ncbi:MAG: hypothetical protein Q9170_008356 [Blastenia crenularia]
MTAARFSRAVTSQTKHHVYVSRNHDVAINLSIEHYLFQKTHPESIALFLYVNQPCIVLGRNQNPWLEVNYAAIRRMNVAEGFLAERDRESQNLGEDVKIIRRRSGGGTVFHDLGNVNFSVICPPAAFHRDKYAEMVVRAIRKTNPRARVNDRHDIVIDPGDLLEAENYPDPDDAHRTAYASGDGALVPRKVSGSAYKLSRQRALHHGTCLLRSPNISSISDYLRSPARPFMKARGVESVRSPIANLFDQDGNATELITSNFQRQVIEAFVQMYNLGMPDVISYLNKSARMTLSTNDGQYSSGIVDYELLGIPEIASGVQEIEAPEYLYGQTPQFILSTHPCEEDNRPRPPLPNWFPTFARIYLKIKSGIILSSNISISEDADAAASEIIAFDSALKDKKVADIDTFLTPLGKASLPNREGDTHRISAWLDLILGKTSDYSPT